MSLPRASLATWPPEPPPALQKNGRHACKEVTIRPAACCKRRNSVGSTTALAKSRPRQPSYNPSLCDRCRAAESHIHALKCLPGGHEEQGVGASQAHSGGTDSAQQQQVLQC